MHMYAHIISDNQIDVGLASNHKALLLLAQYFRPQSTNKSNISNPSRIINNFTSNRCLRASGSNKYYNLGMNASRYITNQHE